MLEYLPDVCRELNGNVREIYWILLIPFTLFTISLEFFQIPERNPNVHNIIKRVVISIIMLVSLEECMNIVVMVGDGITNKINGITQLSTLLEHIGNHYSEMELSWLKLRESIVFILCIISYIIAYAGVFISNILIHFTWSVLYVCSPLMILMYVCEKTSFVTSNLYKGFFNVILWKILWSILGVMLLKFATSPQIGDAENFLTTIMVNLCIGLSMLFIPLATKSLIHDGMSSAASALAMAPAFAIAGVLKKSLKRGSVEMVTGTLNQAKSHMSVGARRLKAPIKKRWSKLKALGSKSVGRTAKESPPGRKKENTKVRRKKDFDQKTKKSPKEETKIQSQKNKGKGKNTNTRKNIDINKDKDVNKKEMKKEKGGKL